MGMFDKIKDMYKLQKQAKQIKNELKNIHIEADSHGILVTINCEMEVVGVIIPEEMRGNEKLEQYVMEAFNKAIQKAQKIAAEKMKGVMSEMGLLSGQ